MPRTSHPVALAAFVAILAVLGGTPRAAAAAPPAEGVTQADLLDLPADSPAFALVPPGAPILGTATGADEGGSAILRGALYGGAAGALIGLGIALIEDDHWFRDVAIGAGAGLIVGGALGASNAMRDARQFSDGLGTTARTPVLHAPSLGVLGGRF